MPDLDLDRQLLEGDLDHVFEAIIEYMSDLEVYRQRLIDVRFMVEASIRDATIAKLGGDSRTPEELHARAERVLHEAREELALFEKVVEQDKKDAARARTELNTFKTRWKEHECRQRSAQNAS